MRTFFKLAALKAFSIGNIDIYWYGLIIVTGMAVAIVLATLLTRYRKDISKENILDAALLVIPLGILGARVFYVLTDGTTWTFQEFFTRPGGMSILGSVIGGSFGLYLIAKIRKLSSLRLRDVIVPCVLVAQAIGRWGNFVNEEVYGMVITNPSWQWFPAAVFIDGTPHLALFFYESIIDLIGAIILYTILRKGKIEGVVGFAYFLWYGFWRAILEGLRMDEYQLGIDRFMASRFVSIIFAVIGAVGIAYLVYKHKKNNPAQALAGGGTAQIPEKADESKNSDANIEKPKIKAEIVSAPTAQIPNPLTLRPKMVGINPALDDFEQEIRISTKIIVPEGYTPEARIITQEESDRLSQELDEIERSLIHIRTAPRSKILQASAQKAVKKPSVKKPTVKKPSAVNPSVKKPSTAKSTAASTKQTPAKPANTGTAAKPANTGTAAKPANTGTATSAASKSPQKKKSQSNPTIKSSEVKTPKSPNSADSQQKNETGNNNG